MFCFLRQTKRNFVNLSISFKNYRKLLILTQITNECLQYYALWVQSFVMFWAIISTAIVMQTDIRSEMEFYELLLLTAIILELYLVFFVVGYSFPGQANRKSRKIKGGLQNKLIGGYLGKVDRKILRSLRDVKIRFGSVNFYAAMTPLVIVKFVLEKSIKIMLLL